MREKQPKQKLITQAITMAIAFAGGGSINAYAQRAALEEVTVTAQKKDESLQAIPMTVTAVSSETIEKYNLLNFQDIAQVTPGLTIESSNPRNNVVSLRGLQVNPDAAAGVAVAIYWNEVNYDIDSAFKSMYDIKQLEVLRGPQGTLRGVTAPAGAITIKTVMPSYTVVDGYMQQSFSDQDLSNTQFGVSLPIIEDMLALRVAGVYDHNDGAGATNVVTGTHESAETRSGRLTVGFRPIDTLEANLVYQYQENFADSLPVLIAGNGSQGNFGRFDRKTATDLDGESNSRRDIALFSVKWNLNSHELNYIAGYQRRRKFDLNDSDAGNAISHQNGLQPDEAIPQAVNTDYSDWSHELRLSSTDGGFYNYTYGIYYVNGDSNTVVAQKNLIGFYGSGAAYADINFVIDSVAEGYAAFTNHSFQITDATEMQIGLRYQKQRMTLDSALSVKAGPVAVPQPPVHKTAIDEAVTGSASIAHQITDDVRIYANYGRSFRPSGNIPVPSDPPLQAGSWDAETSDSIEIGFKSRWNDGRLQFNGDIFYQKFHDFIASAEGIYTNNSLKGVENYTNNFNYSANIIVRGAEISLDALLTDNWQASFSTSYTDAKYDDADRPCNVFVNGNTSDPTTPSDAEYFVCKSSGRLGTEPNWMVSITSEYSWPLGEIEPFVRGLYNFRGMRANDIVPDGNSPAYGVFNLFTGIRDTKNVWEVSIWIKNLFDHEAYTAVGNPIIQGRGNAPTVQTGYTQYKIIPEREIGITGKYSF